MGSIPIAASKVVFTRRPASPAAGHRAGSWGLAAGPGASGTHPPPFLKPVPLGVQAVPLVVSVVPACLAYDHLVKTAGIGLGAAADAFAAGALGVLRRASRGGAGSHRRRPDAQLEALAAKISADPDTGAWVKATRQVVADGSLGPGWGETEVRQRLAQLRGRGQ